jgi:predicted acetyltransferase
VAVEIRVAEPGERLDALRPIWHYFGSPAGPDEERVAGMSPLPDGRLHVASENGAIVAGAGAFEFGMTIPGGPIATAGVTVVGVLPTHRRRGIVRELMGAQLKDAHARGEPIAALWASEGGFYGRFGYGLASVCADVEIPRAHSAFNHAVDWSGSTRLVTADEALELFPPVYDRVAATTPGMISRTTEWWKTRRLADSEWWRAGGGEKTFAVLEQGGAPEAYAIYRLNFSYADGVPTGRTVVLEAMGVTPAATAAVWRYLLDIDWMAKVEAELLPIDHPLHLLLLEQSRMRFRVGDGVWIRPVDVGAALAARLRRRRRHRARGERRVLPVERRALRARRVEDDSAPGSPAHRGRSRLGLPGRLQLLRPPAGGPGRGGQGRRHRPCGRPLPHRSGALVPRDLLSFC